MFFHKRHIAALFAAIIVGFAFVLPLQVFAQTPTPSPIRFQSKSDTVDLIELFTSEGCYSCPPADRWLSSLKNNRGLFTDFIPLSFHVDYWNYLGWRDQYSRPEYSERQRHYHQLGQVSGVYTPGIFLNGYEWRHWRNLDTGEFNQYKTKNKNVVGVLTLEYNPNKTLLRFEPANKNSTPDLAYVALLGADIQAPIAAGENKGKTLHHDFVVLNLQQAAMHANDQGEFVASLPRIDAQLAAPKLAIVAWINYAGKNQPLQATGGWLP